jgi:peptidoglycan hydrolase-like protein with peptidoglycan-binding domain
VEAAIVAATEPTTPAAEAAPAEAAKVEPAPVQVAVAPAADAIPSVVETKLDAGTTAAAVQAAEPRSTAPLRILVTRRTQRDRIIGVQRILAELGYLEQQDFDGTLGKATANAIKAFQKANNMPESGAFTDDLVKKVYEVAGKGEPPAGHIFVRQEYGRVFDAPVDLVNPDEPLGTHVYTAMKFAPGDTKARWMAVTVQGGSPEEALERVKFPDDVRQRISERLTPGSTLIIGDTSINSATLPKGGDFVVLAKYSSPKTAANSGADNGDDQPVKKKRKTVRRNNYNYSFGYNTQPRTFRSYPGWPW